MYLLSSDFRAIASSFCWLDYSTLLFNCPYCRKFLFKLPSITFNSPPHPVPVTNRIEEPDPHFHFPLMSWLNGSSKLMKLYHLLQCLASSKWPFWSNLEIRPEWRVVKGFLVVNWREMWHLGVPWGFDENRSLGRIWIGLRPWDIEKLKVFE